MNQLEVRYPPKVVTIGLGYIGLPTAALIASQKINVLGVDVNPIIVNTVNKGKIHIVEPDLDTAVAHVVKNGFLKASTTMAEASIYLVVVPTPFKDRNEPDISFIEIATNNIIPFLKKGDIYVIESTSPIGTTEKMRDLIYSQRPELDGHIYIAYCPERVLPGNIMHELVHNDRVIGGIDRKSTAKVIAFYSLFVKGKLHSTNARTAEMCKLVENSSRDVQIAFANELSLICDKADINVWELIALANEHPRVNILQPGSGVGGHCIAVDPYFLVSEYPLESKIINTARQINNFKSFWCAEKIQSTKLEFELKYGRKASIAFMGLAFKPNINDLRESPAKYIVQKVLQNDNNGQYFIVEPNIMEHNIFKLTNYKEAVSLADIIVFLVDHREFKGIEIVKDKVVLDFCGTLKG
ncbi:UDP-N-acetyl-D-mannosamine dehydrogenase [Flavobacterium sp. LAR06]|uniref:UDP-N-acetyl-D-mannosamine dehydrogenase n=1 Tax=Flavobacterium sp. LAR06 TaxID=3064897 RepID=UPI0035BF9276